ncbi:MAG: SgcJ/EcaC family oxidoreductase [Acidobacteriota bacterium]|nr:SgcJ/EcaC family oxidoreductase [Acidobacteriota bacterium]
MKKIILICVLLLAASATVWSQQAYRESTQNVLDAFQRGWQAADAHAIAENFDLNGDLSTPDGGHFASRGQIEAFYAAVFNNGYRGSIGTAHMKSVRLVMPGVALIDGEWSIDGAHDAKGAAKTPEHGLFTGVLVKRKGSGRWEIFALREMTPTKD